MSGRVTLVVYYDKSFIAIKLLWWSSLVKNGSKEQVFMNVIELIKFF